MPIRRNSVHRLMVSEVFWGNPDDSVMSSVDGLERYPFLVSQDVRQGPFLPSDVCFFSSECSFHRSFVSYVLCNANLVLEMLLRRFVGSLSSALCVLGSSIYLPTMDGSENNIVNQVS